MKTEYKYIHFVKVKGNPKTSIWICRNNKSNTDLGEVKWYGQWRQYCYFPDGMSVYNIDCLKDIIDFVNQLNKEKRLTVKKLKDEHGISPEEANMI